MADWLAGTVSQSSAVPHVAPDLPDWTQTDSPEARKPCVYLQTSLPPHQNRLNGINSNVCSTLSYLRCGVSYRKPRLQTSDGESTQAG
ncbi:hypothetical protein ElyMa_005944200 [Elysia marginata]|uniref:Uncharacterized protein n=1 Tax=Elysia marginata TaxID=1093978 RepID=A0AAV4GCS5_9GAST|nr:hypothetical protein ElyMa_005944200 [Elysia marginata]